MEFLVFITVVVSVSRQRSLILPHHSSMLTILTVDLMLQMRTTFAFHPFPQIQLMIDIIVNA